MGALNLSNKGLDFFWVWGSFVILLLLLYRLHVFSVIKLSTSLLILLSGG